MPVDKINDKQAAGEPSPAQKEAIEHAYGPMQVLAGPGAGKTYLIIRRIRHLICRHGISPEKILVITFTKAAALEMQQRFANLTEGNYPAVNFGTFHAVYYHILNNSGRGREKYQPISGKEKIGLLRHSLAVCGIRDVDSDTMEQLFKEISARKNRDETLLCMSGRGEIKGSVKNPGIGGERGNAGPALCDEAVMEKFPLVFQEYCRMMEERKQLDFDDMIILCHKMLSENGDILSYWQNRYSHILVDEFQDISPLQYQILKKLAAPGNHLFTVGDDDQSIYGFRGAGPKVMQQFMRDYPEAPQVFLDMNYRCRGNIVRAAALLIEENKDRFPKLLKADREGGEAVKLCAFESWEEEAGYLVKTLKEMSPIEQEKTALIYRTNAQAGGFSRLFQQEGIRFHVHGKTENLWEHPVCMDFLAYLHLARDISETGNGRRADLLRIMNRPCRYIHRQAAEDSLVNEEKLLKYYETVPYMQNRIKKFWGDLKRIYALRPYLALDYIRKSAGYDGYLRGKRDGAGAWMETAKRLQEIVREFASFDEWEAYMENCREQRKEEKEDEKKGVTFITMHSAKGLEYDAVFIPDANAKVIPHSKAVSPGQLEEERRLFYVAMTRAKERLEILTFGQPSRFLEKLMGSPDILLFNHLQAHQIQRCPDTRRKHQQLFHIPRHLQ